MLRTAVLILVAVCPVLSAGDESDFPKPVNTQAAGEHPPAPQEMPGLIDVPPGFSVTLFAGEPDIQQPISFDFDQSSRLWAAENYTYSAQGAIDATLRDRIIILQDTDGDGRHDSRKVFWDRGTMLTSVACDVDGIWILNDGTLAFIPDADHDDVPDSEPVIMLNGWTKTAGHNFVSGLLWGPDGWLYGRHGITDTSFPGTPDTPLEQRQPMNCGIWRFHPVRRTFEVVCHGTTNPWGLDFDPQGQMFMTNNVIGHLWHVIPGAHYERMFGQDFNPHLYELMSQCADHYHWDHTGSWTDSRDGKANDLGGGHSHCGGLIYQGQNFPEQYRGRIFMCNTHGRCVNVDRLERHGSGFVGRHEPNFLTVHTPWFRGVELRCDAEGRMYLSDWSDYGECHDHDGVHRTSGRIYRISWDGETAASPVTSVADGAQAVPRIAWERRWHRRHLQLRAAAGSRSDERRAAVAEALQIWKPGAPVEDRLYACLCLAAMDALTVPRVADMLADPNEHLQAWAVRLGVEAGYLRAPPASPETSFDHADPGDAAPLVQLCRETDSGLVLLTIASSLQKLDSRTRLMVARPLVDRLAEFDDRQLTLMTWYALVDEPSPAGLLYVLSGNKAPPELLKFVARRVVQLSDQRDMVVQQLLSEHGPAATISGQTAVLTGMLQGLRGQHRPQAPQEWEKIQLRLGRSTDPEVVRLARELSGLYGDGAALEDLRTLVADRDGDHAARSQAIAALAQAKDSESLPLMFSLLNDRAVYDAVVRALAEFDHPDTPRQLLSRWQNLRHGTKPLAIDTLSSRRTWARSLAEAVDTGAVDGSELSASQVRQLLSLNDPEIARVIQERWGVINDSPAARTQMIQALTERLTPQIPAAADLQAGAELYKKTCATCHKLYGDGGTIGPDLTGSNRGNPDYLLSNVVDPSAVVPRQFTVSVINLKSGRVITGVVIAETEQSLTVQTDKEQLPIAREDIEEQVRTSKSLMPDGLLDPLSDDQIRDLLGFVMHRR